MFREFEPIWTKYFLEALSTQTDEIGFHVWRRCAQVEICVDFGQLKFQQLLLLTKDAQVLDAVLSRVLNLVPHFLGD